MDRRKLDLPRGVSIRELKTGDRLQIAFSFDGQECRELMPPGTITKSAIQYAAGLRLEIARKIKAGEFRYADYFPESPRAGVASVGRKKIGALLEAQRQIYEKQVETKALSPSTYDGYRKAIESEKMQFWADKTLAEATPTALRAWIGGLGVTTKFARNLLTPLRSVFEDALNDELITFNPFDRIALTKLFKQTAKDSQYVVNPYTAAEREKLLSACRPDEWPMICFWFETGLRPGELEALRWDRVNFKTAKVRIDLNQVAKVEKGPKTEAGIREVDLSEDALRALEAQKPISMMRGPRVWLNPRTGEPWETDAQIRKTLWAPLCKRAGVEYRNPYQIRHTYASSRLTAGENPWYMHEQMGHADVQMIFKTYGKFIRADYQKPKIAKLKVVGSDK